MGNIQREVCPIRVISLFWREPIAVKIISRHQPVKPHLKKFLINLFIIKTVWQKLLKIIHRERDSLMSEQKDLTFREVMDYVEELKIYGSVPGLINIQNLCAKLHMPQNDLKFVHIAGTNGKGSVLAFVSEILKTAGYRVGRYLSPTIFEYRERIQINGRSISKKDLCRLMTVMKEICLELVNEGKPHPTAFEIETAMAFQYFKEKNCQIVVLEAGLGGLLDATNIIEGTLVEVFTSISLDHMGILGKTLYEIAQNKAGIMKKGSVAVAIKNKQQVAEVLEGKAQSAGIPVYFVEPLEAAGVKRSLEKQVFSYKEYKNLVITMAGSYQIENAMLAVETAEQLKKFGYVVSDKALRAGLLKAFWPGRFQILSKKPYFIADGAHNRDGALRLAETIRFYFTNKRIIYIIGMLRDKEQEEILKTLCPLASLVLTVSTKGERGFGAYELACLAKNYHDNVTAVDSVQEAVELSYLLSDKDTVIIACGSLSYLGELITIVESLSVKKNRNEIGRDSHGKQRED